MAPNFKLYALTALIPLITGFIWYNQKVFGNAWLKGAGLTAEAARKGFNMPLVFGLSYVFSFFYSVALGFAVIHQFHLYSVCMPHHGEMLSPAGQKWLNDGMAMFGHNYRTYRHGAFHGTVFGIAAILPVIAINAMFERRSTAYILINAGFWLVNSILMGAIICHWS